MLELYETFGSRPSKRFELNFDSKKNALAIKL